MGKSSAQKSESFLVYQVTGGRANESPKPPQTGQSRLGRGHLIQRRTESQARPMTPASSTASSATRGTSLIGA
jgi:hypothetical protein